MNNRTIAYTFAAVTVLVTAMTARGENLKDVEITDAFPIERCLDAGAMQTSCVGADCNAYLPLEIGRTWTLDNLGSEDREEDEAVVVSVLADTEVIDYMSTLVSTRVLEERESADGELSEVSRNFVTLCGNTQDIIYWGEETCVAEEPDEEPAFEFDCEEGLFPAGDSWKAGVEGAQPGILLPGGAFLIGARYFQEIAVNALDWAENAEIGLSAEDPANGQFEDCVLVIDRNLLEDPKGKEGDEKVYCPNVGIVRDEDLELTSCIAGGGSHCSQP